MTLLLVKHFSNFTWILIILLFNENYDPVAGLKNDNDENFMLVETADNKKLDNTKYLLVKKGNEKKSLIKIESNEGKLHTLNMMNSVSLYYSIFTTRRKFIYLSYRK